MNRSDALDRFFGSTVAVLATVRASGSPHLVPVTFADIPDRIVTMVDHKPKTTTNLQRLANIASGPRVALLAHEYSDDWARLWWVRVDGLAAIHDEGAIWEEARAALVEKYHQYETTPPAGPAIVISIESVSYWESTL
ncbi:MAG: TIGR03668 family PPOX class F420-dependent oxidoreductase [Acidimicrobiia bacterium]